MRVGRRYKFRAQHHVPGLPEPWGSPHWHDYTVEVVFESKPQWTVRSHEELGGRCSRTMTEALLVDHEELDRLWQPWVEKMDGTDLNRLFDITTVEALSQALKDAFGADAVTVWEDDDRWATA